MKVATFAAIEAEFLRRVERIKRCTMATVDGRGRPRARMMWPVWEGTTGWLGTDPASAKAADLKRQPYVALTYWDAADEQIYIEARTEWVDDPAEKARVFALFRMSPHGYDLGIRLRGPDDPRFGLLKLTAERIELSELPSRRQPPRVWRPSAD